MRIVVLVKPVPVVGSERLGADMRTDRTTLELNGNDEYMLERALKLVEGHGGEVSLLAMAPAAGVDALRKGLAIGATRAYHVVDDALAGSDIRATVAVLCAALRTIDADLVFVGAGSSDGAGAVVSAAVAARLRLPYLGDAADIELVGEGTPPTGVRVRRPLHGGHEVVQVGLPAVVMGTQLLGEPRYPSLRGIMAARTREIVTWSLADVGVDPAAVGWGAASTRVTEHDDTTRPRRSHRRDGLAAGGRRRSRGPAGQPGTGLMATVWAVCRAVDGRPSRLGLELATLARAIGGSGGLEVASLVVGDDPAAAGKLLAGYVPRVLGMPPAPARPWAAGAAQLVIDQVDRGHDIVLIGADAEGLALAGMLVGLTDLPILVNATGVAWRDGGVQAAMSTFGGRLQTLSTFTGPGGGIVVVRPGAISAAPADTTGTVELIEPAANAASDTPWDVTLVEHVPAGDSAAIPIEEARIVVGGGRGVGGPDGFRMLGELAEALGGAVGATRAAVDAGWIGYDQQIGQTGKTVRPELYLACGISGAIQHKVGVQTAGTIIAIDRDPDAPIRDFADMFVVGDVFHVVPALIAELRARRVAGR